MSNYLNVQEAAQRLGITRPQVYRRIWNNSIRAELVKQNGKVRWRIPEDAITSYDPDAAEPAERGGYLRTSSVAQLLGISVEDVRRLIREGELIAERGPTGRAAGLISTHAVENYVARTRAIH
jgi:excisionase family DNA binding protein